MEIVNAKYSSSKYSICGNYLNDKDQYHFYAKHGIWRPSLDSSVGAIIMVTIFTIGGQVKISVKVTTNPVFWLLLLTFLFLLGLAVTRTEIDLLYSLGLLLSILGVIALDRLNKKILLSLLERYI